MIDVGKLRKALGLTRLAFANRLGTTERTVFRWENGQARPQGQLMRDAIAALAAEVEAEQDGAESDGDLFPAHGTESGGPDA